MKLLFLDADGTLFHHEGYILKVPLKHANKHKRMAIKSVWQPEDKIWKFIAIY